MGRFKFGRKKKVGDADTSIVSTDQTDNETTDSRHHQPSISSKSGTSVGNHEEKGFFKGSFKSSSNCYDAPGSAPGQIAQVQGNNEVFDNATPRRETMASAEALMPHKAGTPWKRHKLFNSPFPRYRHAASSLASENNEVFLMGGLKEGSVFADTWKLVPHVSPSGTDIDTFQAFEMDIANNITPPARVGHASILCGNAYIVYGGDTVDTDESGFPDDDFYMFNINNRKYTVPSHVADKPLGRYGHSLVVVSPSSTSTRLYLFGGQLEDNTYDDIYYFELTLFKSPDAKWVKVAPCHDFKPPPLSNHSMCVYKTRLYVFGGVYNNEKATNDVWCFDTVSEKWQQILTSGEKPLPVNEHSACIVGDNMFVFGGNNFSGLLYNTLYCLNLHSHIWTRLSFADNGPSARCGHSMTHFPKLNKLLIMGGDKNDYIHTQTSNYDINEDADDPESGTMLYVLDVDLALHLMNKFAAEKHVASASSDKEIVFPSPSGDVWMPHRRIVSAGCDGFRTPSASVEKFRHSLDPQGVVAPSEQDFDAKSHINAATEPENSHIHKKSFHVHSSSAASSAIVMKELNEIRDTHLQDQDLQNSSLQPDSSRKLHEASALDGASPIPDFMLNCESENRAYFQNSSIEELPLFASEAAEFDSVDFSHETPSHSEIGMGTIAHTLNGARLSPSKSLDVKITELASEEGGSSSKSCGSTCAKEDIPEDDSMNTEEVAILRQVLAGARAELSQLKNSPESQTTGVDSKRHGDLATQNIDDIWRHSQALSKVLAEKDPVIQEIMLAVDPSKLENGEESNDQASRGFTKLAKYKISCMQLINKLAYVDAENAQLKVKHAQLEPFINHKFSELAALQKVVERQEQRIEDLVGQLKSQSLLRKDIATWKHKYENLELDFNTYRSTNAEIYVSDDEDEEAGEHSTVGKKSISSLSSNLESLVALWRTNPVNAESRSLALQDTEFVRQLQEQIENLTNSLKAQQQGCSAEIQGLETELKAKSATLKTFEENYRDALQSVNNTSKALELTQDEMKAQKLLIEKLLKENNELKLFKKAASVSKKHLLPISDSGHSNGSSPVQIVHVLDTDDDNEEEEFTAAHYNMKLKDLEADLYIMKQERDSLTDQVSVLKKELYLMRS